MMYLNIIHLLREECKIEGGGEDKGGGASIKGWGLSKKGVTSPFSYNTACDVYTYNMLPYTVILLLCFSCDLQQLTYNT